MECQECQKEIGKTIFFRQGQEKEKFCSNECCDKYWEGNTEFTCYICNGRIKEGDFYYNHNDDPQLKICVNCRRRGGKSQAEKDYEENELEIARLERENQEIEQDSRKKNNIEWQNRLNFQRTKLNRLKAEQKNNKPQHQRSPNKNIPNSPNQNNNQNQSAPNPNSNPILPNSVKEWFQKNSVKLIKLADNEWIIEYNGGSKFTIPVANVSELQEAKSYLQAVGKNSLSASELNISSSQASSNPSPNSNLPLYIGGGVIVFLLVIIIVLLARKKDK